MKQIISAAIAALMLFVSSAFAAEVGEFVRYDRGQTFHIELRATMASPEIEKVMASYAGKENPMAYAYKVSDKAKDFDSGYAFAGCDLTVDVTVTGLSKDFSQKTFDFTNGDLKKVGTVSASATGDGSVTITGVKLGDGRRNIVLPFAFVGEENPPTVTVKPVGFTVTASPFCKNGACTSSFLHRIARTKGGEQAGDGKVNVGYIPPGLHVPQGTCKGG